MSDEEQPHPSLFLKLPEEPQYLGLDRDVERRGRLVGDEKRWLAGERNCDADALSHPAAQFVRVGSTARGSVGDADLFE